MHSNRDRTCLHDLPWHVVSLNAHTYRRRTEEEEEEELNVDLNSVSGLVSMLWYRSPFDQSNPSKAKIPPTKYPADRPGRDP
jgi:hypothetical protein